MITKIFRAAFVLFGLLACSVSAQLIISEYVDANTTRGAIELWNVSGTNVTFGTGSGQSDIRIEIYADGSVVLTANIVLTPGFTVAAGSVFVLGHSSAPFAPICDQLSGLVSWTGNDTILVRRGAGTVIDSLGQFGFNPGTEWGTGSASTADNTLRRIAGNMIADSNPGDPYEPALYFEGYPLNNTEHLGLPPLANSLPSVGTYPPTSVSPSNATLSGEVNSHNTTTTMWFDYGTSTNYGTSTPLQVAGSGVHGYQYVLTGLVSGVTYHYRAAASNSLGIVFGTNVSFTTPFPAASVTTLPASGIWTNTSTLNGSANPQGGSGLAWFVWAAQPPLNTTTPPQPIGNGTVATNFSATLTGLASGTAHFYQAVASNAAGIVYGAVVPFATKWLPAVSTLPAIDISATNATLRGEANPDGVSTLAWFEWGLSTNYGNVTVAQSLGSGTDLVNFSQIIGGLAGATYHFRAGLSNELGLVFGSNESIAIPSFVNIPVDFPYFLGSSAWGDYDNDGRLDIALTGSVTNERITRLFRNLGSNFSSIELNIQNSYEGLGWVDADNNGWLDFWLANSTTQIWTNSGTGFRPNPGTNLAFGGGPSVSWADYDNDGRSDLLASGSSVTQLRRNTPEGFVLVPTQIPFGTDGLVLWADYDSDGWKDFLLTSAQSNTRIWRNNTEGNFDTTNLALPFFREGGGAAWGDYDGDARPDFVFFGSNNTGVVSQIWRNTGTNFTNINAGLPGIFYGSAAWGDYDSDGRSDLLLVGVTSLESNFFPRTAISEVWRNTGSGFVKINAGLPGVGHFSGVWGDYDKDGRLDILLIGWNTNGTAVIQLWRNQTLTANTAPTAPAGLQMSLSNSLVTLSWMSANDAQTPAGGLTYNVRIGTTPGGTDILAPMAAADGFRRVPQIGNAEGRLFAKFKYVTGVPYYWSVQAIDTSFAGSPFAAEQNFRVLQPAPSLVSATQTNTAGAAADSNGDGIVSQSELDAVLVNYWPHAPWLSLTNIAGLGDTNVSFTLSNATAGAFSVESSTNLFNWNFLGPAIPRYEFIDTNAPAGPQRYYRLRWP